MPLPVCFIVSNPMLGAFTIYKVDGSEITVGEGYALMLPYGELDICETATSHKAGDAPAINVQFRMYDASRDLVTVSALHCSLPLFSALANIFSRRSATTTSIGSSQHLTRPAEPGSGPRTPTNSS